MKVWVKKIFIFVAIILWIFSVFALPVAAIEMDFGSDSFRVFAIGQALLISLIIWRFAVEAAIVSAAVLYGVRDLGVLKQVMKLPLFDNAEPLPDLRLKAMVSLLISYFMMVYMYAIVYGLLSKLIPDFLNQENISFISALYFSVVTITTVGFGDIHAVSDIAKLIVVTEILFGVVYTVFLFSIIASFLLKRRTD